MQESNPKSKIFFTAWSLFKGGYCSTFSDALRLSWKQHKVTTGMKSGKYHFSFRKVNGEIREAVGTLNAGMIDYIPTGTGKKSPVNICKYFDIDRNAYRSYRIENLV